MKLTTSNKERGEIPFLINSFITISKVITSKVITSKVITSKVITSKVKECKVMHKKLMFLLLHVIKTVVDNSTSDNYGQEIYLDFNGIWKKSSIIDIIYHELDTIDYLLKHKEEIYVMMTVHYGISDNPIIMITVNPQNYLMASGALKLKIVNGRCEIKYANYTTESNK